MSLSGQERGRKGLKSYARYNRIFSYDFKRILEEKMAASNKPSAFKKILLPIDFSSTSEDAAAYAVMMAKTHKAALQVLHVVDVSEDAAGLYVPHLSYEKFDKEMVTGATDMLVKFCSKACKGFKNFEIEIVTGNPYKSILKVAKNSGADLVVMGAFGRGRLDKLLFGSTTERVMRKSKCPVLIVHPTT